MHIQKNLQEIKRNIKEAANKSGRDEKDITLIAVTKTVDEDIINEALELEIQDIGENKVQEIQRKYDNIKEGIKWHMIGHLQSNKVKYIIDKVSLIHSLDRISLAKEIQKRAKQNNITMDCLVQVNISEEESKFGLKKEKVITFIESVLKYENIKIKGLMTMAPYMEDSEKTRCVFRELKKLSQEIEERAFPGVEMKFLSMGMTNDYMVAIEEGSNMVRIGTGIFGKRNY
ncbi:YggS family pyridoxal phosphate-dependent enzyme [Sporosalibacterium faouarense]|uniref:YggS family pyridoxal phosphate-dependent enzyme n=1 Tax=Sporosalibacterium faouarense TaxID=516123 RepID=UPI002434A227|nr:YggS family pyridoxal phosphate-dependent enzyme [Sporosalibacterium faouarense]